MTSPIQKIGANCNAFVANYLNTAAQQPFSTCKASVFENCNQQSIKYDDVNLTDNKNSKDLEQTYNQNDMQSDDKYSLLSQILGMLNTILGVITNGDDGINTKTNEYANTTQTENLANAANQLAKTTQAEKSANADGIETTQTNEAESTGNITEDDSIDTSKYYLNEGDELCKINSDNIGQILSSEQMRFLTDVKDGALLSIINSSNSVCRVREDENGGKRAIIECRDNEGKLIKSISVNDDSMYYWDFDCQDNETIGAEGHGSYRYEKVNGETRLMEYGVFLMPYFGVISKEEHDLFFEACTH